MAWLVTVEATTATKKEAQRLLAILEDEVGHANAELFDSKIENDVETEEV